MKCEKEDIEIEKGFPEMFDFSDKSSNDVGLTILCPNENEAYDVTAKVCRPFSLEIEGRNKSDNCSGNLSSDFNECLVFNFNREEYILNDNCTVEVIPHNKLYGEGNFRITEDYKLQLCAEYRQAGLKFNGPITYLMYIGLGVSFGFLFLHLVVFATNPALRNISDKNLASLCTALLVAYGASIIGRLLNDGSKLCQFHSISTQILPLHSYIHSGTRL